MRPQSPSQSQTQRERDMTLVDGRQHKMEARLLSIRMGIWLQMFQGIQIPADNGQGQVQPLCMLNGMHILTQ